jgi:hypothetical protein
VFKFAASKLADRPWIENCEGKKEIKNKEEENLCHVGE